MICAPYPLCGRERDMREIYVACAVIVTAIALFAFVTLRGDASADRAQAAIDDDARACVLAVSYPVFIEAFHERTAVEEREAEAYAKECAERGDVTLEDVLRVAGYERDGADYDLTEPLP